MQDEVALSGGRITQGVYKKGNQVIRPCCPNSVFVHNVLKWLEQKGIDCAPRFIGLTEEGREITSFLEGSAPDDLGYFSNEQLSEAGRIIKKLHMTLEDFPGCTEGQTVCHNDLSPCNFMFKDDMPYAVFDWDAAAIGNPIDDVAYAIWMWCDIGNPDNPPEDVGNRIKIILDSYGLQDTGRGDIAANIHKQIQRVNTSMTKFLTDTKQHDKMKPFHDWINGCTSWLSDHKKEIEQVISILTTSP